MKCHLACEQVEYLGHVGSAAGIQTYPKKMRGTKSLAMSKDWPRFVPSLQPYVTVHAKTIATPQKIEIAFLRHCEAYDLLRALTLRGLWIYEGSPCINSVSRGEPWKISYKSFRISVRVRVRVNVTSFLGKSGQRRETHTRRARRELSLTLQRSSELSQGQTDLT